MSGDSSKVILESFALVPKPSDTAPIKAGSLVVRRLLGLNGALAWARPEGAADPAFRNVAWGPNRPIIYKVKVARGSRKKIALGFCESYRTTAGARATEVHIEGSAPRLIDLVADAKRNQPQVFLFDGKDQDNDGELHVELRPSSKVMDPNIFLNALWVFRPDASFTPEVIVSGRASKQAELYLDCGAEPEIRRLPTRIDAIRASISGTNVVPVIRVRTQRDLSFDAKSGVLIFEGRPFVASNPRARNGHKTDTGWELELPLGTSTVQLTAISGYRLPKNIAAVPDLQKERMRALTFWANERRYPRNRIQVPDQQLQFLLDAGMRTLYQCREVVDGVAQFQPGSTVYRGLWIQDALYDIDGVLMEGDTASAREATEGLFRYQENNGKVKVIWPADIHRDTPNFIWSLVRYARLANNREWLQNHWQKIVSAMRYIQESRKSTLTDPQSPFYGLMPPGFVDGGISGVTADYSSVYWVLICTERAVEAAEWLGKSGDAREWRTFYQELLSSYRTVAARDIRKDTYGNQYLPVKVADTTRDVPQRAQWVLCEAVNLGSFLSQGDPIVPGTLAVLDSSCVQGLPVSFGWMTGGIGVWFAPVYGLAHYINGNVEKAVDVLYAFANHATPLGAWAEEQMPKGVSTRTTGDFPTNSAYASMLKLVVSLLADDKGASVELLRGIPADWLVPGSLIRANDLLTKFGRISVEASISKDRRSGNIVVSSAGYRDADDSMAQYTDTGNTFDLWLTAFKQAGFRAKDGSELESRVRIRWNQKIELEFQR
ncbi:MAG: Bac rhamnosid6H protein [Bacteroidetes bacterium]|nr:Bac rhamnosid6H protein [Bacteroidota bacterium]